VTRDSSSQITSIIQYFHGLGVKNVFLETLQENNHAKTALDRFGKPSVEQMILATEEALSAAKDLEMRIGRGRFTTSAARTTGCVAVSGRSFVITPTNKICACYECTDDRGVIGDLFTIGHIDALRQTAVLYEDKIARLQTRNVDNLPACKECFAKYICGGGCAVRGIRETGDFFGVFKEECDLIRSTIRQMIYLLWRESRVNAGTRRMAAED
jgi:radical SAM protein with 4Fe4S-binding SPASM domain